MRATVIASDLHRLAGGRHTHQLAVIRPLRGPGRDDNVALGDLLVRFERPSRRCEVHLGDTLRARGPGYICEGVLGVVVIASDAKISSNASRSRAFHASK